MSHQSGTGYDKHWPMKKKLQFIWQVIKDAGTDFSDNVVTQKAAALAYYTIFSLAPMLIVLITTASIFYGREAVEGQLFGQIKGFVGRDAAAQIQAIIKSAAISNSGVIATSISVAALVFSATGVFTEIQGSINAIWNIRTKPKKGWLKFLQNRFLSFSMLIGLGFILIVSLVVSAVLDSMLDRLLSRLPENFVVISYIINLVITFFIIASLFGIIFKWLPDAEIEWRDVRSGAMATALLFMIGRFLIGLYLTKANPGGAYGTAGSLIVILLWVNYSSIILYFGATFTKAWACRTGREIHPNKYAVFVRITEEHNTDSLVEQSAPPPEPKAYDEQAAKEFGYVKHPDVKQG